jgi:hypothetical protein
MFARLIVLCCSLLYCASGFAADAPSLATLLDAKRIRSAVASSTHAEFDRFVSPTRDQSDAARQLITDARDALNREVNRHLRSIRTGIDSAEAGNKSEADMIAAIDIIERQLITDLRTLITPDQEQAFDRFNMARRRNALLVNIGGGITDLTRVLRDLKIDTTRDPQLLQAALDGESTVDAALVAAAQSRIDFFASIRASAGRKAESDALNRMRIADARLQQEDVQSVRRLTPLLQETERNALALRRAEAYFAWYNNAFNQGASTHTVPASVREVQRLQLTDQQRASLKARLDRFNTDYLAAVTAWLSQRDDAVLRNDNPSDITNRFLSMRDDLRKALDTETLALLTDQQRREYDASPLLETDGSWEVEDESMPAETADN